MANFMDWGDSTSSKFSGGEKSQFLKLQAGNKYRLRLVYKPIRYYQHWEPVICRSPGADPVTKQIIDPLMLEGIEPKQRFACWVIDRADGQLKIMDFPGVLFDFFKEWKINYNDEPGGENGPDWAIKLEQPPGGNKTMTKYKAMALDRTPFTPDEKKLITPDLTKRLAELRKDNTPDEIREMLAKKRGSAAPANKAEESKNVSREPVVTDSADKSIDF